MFSNLTLPAFNSNLPSYIDFIITNLIATLGLISNYLVIKAIRDNSNLRSNTYALIANQSLAQLIYCFGLILPNLTCIDKCMKSSLICTISCELTYVIQVAGIECCMWCVSAIAFERFYKLYFPLNADLSKSKQIALIWFLSFVVSIGIGSGKELTTHFAENRFYGCLGLLF